MTRGFILWLDGGLQFLLFLLNQMQHFRNSNIIVPYRIVTRHLTIHAQLARLEKCRVLVTVNDDEECRAREKDVLYGKVKYIIFFFTFSNLIIGNILVIRLF